MYITPVIELSNIPDIQANWHDDLLKNALGRDGNNQGIFISDEKVKNCFDWKDCQQQPDCVVKRFLELLDRNR
ncbi:hypothetical protein [Nostoc commune]|uniref:hypothetical protein n=1 Tax=Nostoc commune TaxID=1178 RepID=UPI0018C4D957|nr:hypothetical protein [Nostoc commune]MBG1258870.1 hypothetical protein [Nostoc commune BAE]